jgi:hypothetical protein
MAEPSPEAKRALLELLCHKLGVANDADYTISSLEPGPGIDCYVCAGDSVIGVQLSRSEEISEWYWTSQQIDAVMMGTQTTEQETHNGCQCVPQICFCSTLNVRYQAVRSGLDAFARPARRH